MVPDDSTSAAAHAPACPTRNAAASAAALQSFAKDHHFE